MRRLPALLLAFALVGCATYREDLNRGQRYFDEHQYEKALALFRSLERDIDSLEFKEQARYAYLRGMTGLSLGFRSDARHWLAIAKAIEQVHPGGLGEGWKAQLEAKLGELNEEVYKGGESFGKSRSTADVTTRPPPGTCKEASDCPEGQSCQSGECVPL